MATRGGSELLVNHICFLLESNSEWTVLKTEVKNAFNYIQRRSSLLKSIHLHFHPCSTTFIKCTPLTVPLSTKMECHFTSSECIKETLLVPTSFQLPFTSPCDTQSRNPGVRCPAYLNDIFMMGQSNHFFPLLWISSQLSIHWFWRFKTRNVKYFVHISSHKGHVTFAVVSEFLKLA